MRYRLFNESKFSKYLGYGIGEIILVVIGILVALQINNWNENRKDREKEIVLLNQIQQEFKASFTQLNNKIDQRNMIMHSANQLLSYIDQGEVLDSDSFIHHLTRTLFIPTFNANTSDFFSARDISLIQNDSLRVLLSDWPSQVEQLSEEELQWVDYRNSQYLPFLTSNFATRNLYAGILLDIDMMRNVFLDSSKLSKTRIGDSKKIADIDHLINAGDFEDHLGFAIMIHGLCNVQSLTLAHTIENIIEQIDE